MITGDYSIKPSVDPILRGSGTRDPEQLANTANKPSINFNIPPLERLRSYLQSKGWVDDAWNVTVDMNGEPLLHLHDDQLERLKSLLCDSIDIVSKDKKHSFSIKLSDLLLKLIKDPSLPNIESIEIIGGATYWILGREYVERIVKKLGGDLSEIMLQSEIEALFARPPDLDIRVNIGPRQVHPHKGWLESYFQKKILKEEDCSTKLQALHRGDFIKPKLVENQNTCLSALIFGNRKDYKVDLIFAAALPRKYLVLPDDLRIVVHNCNAISLERLLSSNFSSCLLRPTGENACGLHGLIARLGKLAPIPFDAQLDTINESGIFGLATLATKDYLLPSHDSCTYLIKKIVAYCDQNRDDALTAIEKEITNHFHGKPLAALSYCLNLYNMMLKSGSTVDSLNILHQKLCTEGILKDLSISNEESPLLNSLCSLITNALHVDVLLPYLKLMSGLFAQEYGGDRQQVLAFAYNKKGEHALKLNNHSYSISLDLCLAQAMQIFHSRFSEEQQKENNENLEPYFIFCLELLKEKPFEMAPEKNHALIDTASSMLEEQSHPFLQELSLLLLSRYQYSHLKHIKLTPLLNTLYSVLEQEKSKDLRKKLLDAVIYSLKSAPNIEHLVLFFSDIEKFSLYISKEKLQKTYFAWYWCNVMSKVPHQDFQLSAYKVWKTTLLNKDLQNYSLKLEMFLKAMTFHSPYLALKVISSAHDADVPESALTLHLQQIVLHYRTYSTMREGFPELPLLAQVTTKLLIYSEDKSQIVSFEDLHWLIHQLINYAPQESMGLLAASMDLFSTNVLSDQQLEVYYKICSLINHENIDSKWSSVKLCLEKIASLSHSTSERTKAKCQIEKTFSYLLQSAEYNWPCVQFLIQLFSLSQWNALYHNDNQSRITLLLDWCNKVQESDARAPTSELESRIDLLLLGCKCKPLAPYNGKLAIALLNNLKAYPAVVKTLPKELLLRFQELRAWLVTALQPHPLDLVDFFNITKKQNGTKEIPLALLNSLFKVLHDILIDDRSSQNPLTFVVQHFEMYKKAAQRSSSPSETHLRLLLIERLISTDDLQRVLYYLKAIIPLYIFNATAKSSEIYDNDAIAMQTMACAEKLLDRCEWKQVNELLSFFSGHHPSYSSKELAVAYQRLCINLVSNDIEASATILINQQKLLADYDLLLSLEAVAYKCAQAILKDKNSGKRSYEIATHYALHDVGLWSTLIDSLLASEEKVLLQSAVKMLGGFLKDKLLSTTHSPLIAQCWHTLLKAAHQEHTQAITTLGLLNSPDNLLDHFVLYPELGRSAAFYLIMTALKVTQPEHEKISTLLTVAEAKIAFDANQTQAIDIAIIKCFASSQSQHCYLQACQRLTKLCKEAQIPAKLQKELLQKVATHCITIVDEVYEPQLFKLFTELKTMFITKNPDPLGLQFLLAPFAGHPFSSLQAIAHDIAVSILTSYTVLPAGKPPSTNPNHLIPHCVFEKPLTDHTAKENRKLLFSHNSRSFFHATQLSQLRHKLILYYLDKAVDCANDPLVDADKCDRKYLLYPSPICVFKKVESHANTQENRIERSTLQNEEWIQEAQSLFIEYCRDPSIGPLLMSEGLDKAIDLALKFTFERNSPLFYGRILAYISTQFADTKLLTDTFIKEVKDLNSLGTAFEIKYENSIPFEVDENWRRRTSATSSGKGNLNINSTKQDIFYDGLSLLLQKMLVYKPCIESTTPLSEQELWLQTNKTRKMIHQYCFLHLTLLCKLYPKAGDSLVELIHHFSHCSIPIDNIDFLSYHLASLKKLLILPNINNLQKQSWGRLYQIHYISTFKRESNEIQEISSLVEGEAIKNLIANMTSQAQHILASNHWEVRQLAVVTDNRADFKRLHMGAKHNNSSPQIAFVKKLNENVNHKYTPFERLQLCWEMMHLLAIQENPIYLHPAIELMIIGIEELDNSSKYYELSGFYKFYQAVFEAITLHPYVFLEGSTLLERLKHLVEITCAAIDDNKNLKSNIMLGYINTLYQIYAQYPEGQTAESMYHELFTKLLQHIQSGCFANNLDDLAVFVDKLIPFAQRCMLTFDGPSLALEVMDEVTEVYCQAEQCYRELGNSEYTKSLVKSFNTWLKVLFELDIPEISQHATTKLDHAISNDFYQNNGEALFEILKWSVSVRP